MQETKILNLLENNAPLKAIKADSIPQMDYIIRNSFPMAYKELSSLGRENWYFIISLNPLMNSLNILGLVQFDIKENSLEISWLEVNRTFRKKGYSREIIKYLTKYAEFLHLKEIISLKDDKIWNMNGFEKKLNIWKKQLVNQ